MDGTSTLVAVTVLITSLALSAALLSATGLYLVIAFVVHEQRRSTAIRSALGASRQQVMWHHFKMSGAVLVAALPAGVLLSVAAAPFVSDLLYGVGHHDWRSLAAAVAIAAAAGILGTSVPVRRAARATVLKVLREA
jgi:putative ABC transport system permease protein